MRRNGKKAAICRMLAGLTAMALAVCLLGAGALAQEVSSNPAWIGSQRYDSLEEAIKAAEDGATIMLGEGNYSSYGTTVSNQKTLTFIGAGAGKTIWQIGREVPKEEYLGTEYNGDYSFDGCGTITFQNMTLQSGTVNYLGFIRINHTVVENCVINGKTFYWGYQTARFTNTTFNAPGTDYALWVYYSKVMTFDGCTFNVAGKVANVYKDYNPGEFVVTVNFKDCTVNSAGPNKSALNIKDEKTPYIINISGTNTVTGLVPNETTCSRLFEVQVKNTDGSDNPNNGIYATVNIDGKTVWTKGKMVAHAIDTQNDKYTDGYKDHAFTESYTEWVEQPDGSSTRTRTSVCNYCGYTKETTEVKEAAPTQAPTTEPTTQPSTAPTIEPTAVPTAAPTLAPTTPPTIAPTAPPTTPPTSAPTAPPSLPPKTGDTSQMALWLALALAAAGGLAAIAFFRKSARSKR